MGNANEHKHFIAATFFITPSPRLLNTVVVDII